MPDEIIMPDEYNGHNLKSMENPAGICRMGSLVGPCGNNFREAIRKYCYCFSIDRGLIKYLQIKLR